MISTIMYLTVPPEHLRRQRNVLPLSPHSVSVKFAHPVNVILLYFSILWINNYYDIDS